MWRHMLRSPMVGLALCAVLLGCGRDGVAGAPIDEGRMYQVATDPDASAEEIIEAGVVSDLEVDGTGRLYVAYEAQPESDELESALAWRLYDSDGDPVATGKYGNGYGPPPTATGLPGPTGGFLLSDSFYGPRFGQMGADGEILPAPVASSASPPEPGDLVVKIRRKEAGFYRPADDLTYPAPATYPSGGTRAIAVDDSGGAWIREQGGRPQHRVSIGYAANEVDSFETTVIEGPARTLNQSLVVTGEFVFVPFHRAKMAGGLVELRVRRVADSDRTGWSRVDLTGLLTRGWETPTIAALDDGRVLIGEIGEHWYVGTTGAWEKIPLPVGGDYFDLELHQDRLYAVDRASARGRAYVSDDLGQSWSELPR